MTDECDLLITNARAVIPRHGSILETNILIEKGKIKDFKKSTDGISCSKRIDAKNKFVIPGLIDPHVHYGVFSPINESARTESKSAAIGGVTTIFRMLRTFESFEKSIVNQIKAGENNHLVDYSIHASILNHEQVNSIPFLYDRGISSYKLYMNLGSTENRILMDMRPYEPKLLPQNVHISDDLCYETIEKASSFKNSIVLVHAEDHEMCSSITNDLKFNDNSDNKSQNKHSNPLILWSKCRPPESESIAIKKIMNMGRKFKSNLYFVHIGSSVALDTILTEKQSGGCNAYIETCPHYLTHSVEFGNLKGKVVPPLRSKNDISSLWMAIKNGVIDTIGTDHVANTLSLKYGADNDIWSALAGFPGVATMLPVMLHYGFHLRGVSLERIVDLTSFNASRIFGLYPKKGTLEKGSDADLVIVDIDETKKVTPDVLQSSSDYTIYDGQKLQGWPICTVSRGEIVMEDGITDESKIGHGEFIRRA